MQNDGIANCYYPANRMIINSYFVIFYVVRVFFKIQIPISTSSLLCTSINFQNVMEILILSAVGWTGRRVIENDTVPKDMTKTKLRGNGCLLSEEPESLITTIEKRFEWICCTHLSCSAFSNLNIGNFWQIPLRTIVILLKCQLFMVKRKSRRIKDVLIFVNYTWL